jgi:hypothetical protein
VAFVQVCILGFIGYRAHAQMGEVLLGVGAEMLRYRDADSQDDPRTLFLNGERVHFATGTTRHSLERVLDHYQSKCQQVGSFADELALLRESDLESSGEDKGIFDGVVRASQGKRGVVACLEGAQSESIRDKLERFERTADLSDIGDLRYVYAEEGDGVTLFAAFWTEGSFNMGRLFPPEGDAPGRDVEDVPRPPGSKRLLSSFEEGQPQAMTIYAESSKSPTELRRFYRADMKRRGWQHLTVSRAPEGMRLPEEAQNTLVFERGPRMVIVVVGEDEEMGGTATVLTAR